MSTGDSLTLRFKSDTRNTDDGFKLLITPFHTEYILSDPALDLSTVVMAVSVYLVATNVTTTASVGSPLMSVR